MIKSIIDFVQRKIVSLTTGRIKQGRLKRLKNGVPLGSIFAPLVYNIYIHDLLFRLSWKNAYADSFALLHTLNKGKSSEQGGLKPRHEYTFRVSPNLNAKA